MMPSVPNYSCTPRLVKGKLEDLIFQLNGREIPMLGTSGPERELSCIPHAKELEDQILCMEQGQSKELTQDQKKLVVLLGAGFGKALEKIIIFLENSIGKNYALAVVDRGGEIAAQTGVLERFPQVHWVLETESAEALKNLTAWQAEHSGKAFFPIVNPFYLRLDRNFYDPLIKACQASQQADFWGQVKYRRFQNTNPRILLLTSKYFLIGEIIEACKRLGYEYQLISLPDGEFGQNQFVEDFLTAVLEFKPDFAMTINHLGVDREGVLTNLLEKLRLPLASWFVDNPHLVLHLYANLVSPYVALFTWDKDNLPSLKNMGFEHVWYMPLGVDHTRFIPITNRHTKNTKWRTRISFVGNSMVKKVCARMGTSTFPKELTQNYRDVAGHFAISQEHSVAKFLQENYPNLAEGYSAMPRAEDKLGFETMLTWEATLQYRLSCVEGILPFKPLIVGDDGWFEILPKDGSWTYHSEVNYYHDLPEFYPLSDINFNCTSKQMKGAVNQRVFDVPATESFILTDFREQIAELFEIGKEVICFHSPSEATELAARFLGDDTARKQVAKLARKRILAEHTYDQRMKSLAQTMRKTFG